MIYYNSIETNKNFILSCDMIRLTFVFSEFVLKDFNKYINNLGVQDSRYIYTMYTSTSSFSYKYILNFKYDNSSFVVGLGFNGIKKLDALNCFIEFNPNKCLSNKFVSPVLDYIKFSAKHLELARFDLAIDIPCSRSLVSFTKDKRDYNKIYRIEKTSSDIENVTEYLGKRNNNGFTKLYNKTLESGLNYECTRLELTLDSLSYENFVEQFPKVLFCKKYNLLEFSKLSATDKVLFSLILQSENSNLYLKMLGREKRKKFKDLMFDSDYVTITEQDFYLLTIKVRELYL